MGMLSMIGLELLKLDADFVLQVVVHVAHAEMAQPHVPS